MLEGLVSAPDAKEGDESDKLLGDNISGEKLDDVAFSLKHDAFNSGLFHDDFKSLQGQGLIDRMAKDYIDLATTKRTAVNIPTEDSTDEERASFFKSVSDIDGLVVLEGDEDSERAIKRRMGIPDDGKGYDLPEGRFSEKDEQGLRVLGETLSLSNKQLLKLADVADSEKENQAKADSLSKQKVIADRNEVLNKMWGADAQKRFSGAELAVKHLSNEVGGEWLEHFKKSDSISNPLVVMALSKLGDGLIEKGTLVDTQVNYGQTVADIKRRIHAIRGEEDYFTTKPRAKELRKELISLQSQLPS